MEESLYRLVVIIASKFPRDESLVVVKSKNVLEKK